MSVLFLDAPHQCIMALSLKPDVGSVPGGRDPYLRRSAMTNEKDSKSRADRVARLEVLFATERMSIEELEAMLARYEAASEEKGPELDPQLLKVLRDWLEST